MSDTENTLLARVAALESELAIKRKNDGPTFDKRKATLDPLNYFKEQGLDVEHLTRVFVANSLGKDCPPQLAAMVQQGPQILATSNLEKMVQSLAETVQAIVNKDKEKDLVASVKNTPVDPSKYPTLAAAIKTDSKILDSELKSLGNVADSSKALEQIEAKMASYAKALGWKPPASDSKNDGKSSTEGKSETTTITDPNPQFRSANQGTSGSEVPPLLPNSSGVMTDEIHEQLKAAVLKKHSVIS